MSMRDGIKCHLSLNGMKMAKKQAAKDQDKFVVRLPPGLRDRIKERAEHSGMSMNEAIVWCLEKAFPAKVTLQDRIGYLTDLVVTMKDANNPDAGVENLIAEMETTLVQISDGVIKAGSGFRDMVNDRLQLYTEREMENWQEQNESPFDDGASGYSHGNHAVDDDFVVANDTVRKETIHRTVVVRPATKDGKQD